MSIASSQQSFLINALIPTQKPRTNIATSVKVISCSNRPHDHKDCSRKNDNQWAKLAIVTLAAGVLTLGSVGDAVAAKSGGRVGGQAFRSPAPRSAPRASSKSNSSWKISADDSGGLETSSQDWTNIYINPPGAPPLVGGYGYGYGAPYYGGWGWSPFSFFVPGPSVAIGFGGGFDLLALFLILGAAAAVVRKFFGSRDEEEDY